MADRQNATGASGAAGRAPTADRPDAIRNVVLVGHSGAGKTTLAEALLVAAGALTRAGRVEDGTTVTDHDDAERRQQRSVGLALAPLLHEGIKVNLLDAPGYADFVGELRAGLRAADAALFVISAVDGVDGATRMLWEECAAVGMPRAVVVTKLDQARADFDESLAVCQRVFGDGVLPLYLPVHGDDEGVAGLLGLLSQQIYDYSDGTRVVRAPDPEHLEIMSDRRNELIEAIIQESEDDSLMDRYLSGEDVALDVLIPDLEQAVARGSFYPVLAAAPLQGIGTAEILEILTQAFPSPLEHPLPAVTSPDGSPKAPIDVRPGRPARGRGRQDDVRPLRRPAQPGAGLLRHPAPGLDRARLGPLRPVHPAAQPARPRRERPRGPRRRRTGRRPLQPARLDPTADHGVHRRGHLRGGQAGPGRDRRHPLGQGRPVAGRTVDPAGGPAAGGHRRGHQVGRGQALTRAATAGRRGPDPAVGEQPGDPPAGALDDGRGPRRRAARPALHAVRRPGDVGAAAGVVPRDVLRTGQRSRPTRQAERRTRPVRRVRHQGRAARLRGGLRVRRQGGRRRGTSQLHPERREGREGADGAWRPGGLPGRRHPGHPGRRQGALGRLERHGLPERRSPRPSRGGQGMRRSRCSSRWTRWRSASPTSTSGR